MLAALALTILAMIAIPVGTVAVIWLLNRLFGDSGTPP